MIKGIAKGLIVFLLAAIFSVQGAYAEPVSRSVQAAAGYTLEFPSSRYPENGRTYQRCNSSRTFCCMYY